jgi:hypothetical protein
MTTETPHLGTMMWTRGENTRPMTGSEAHEKAQREHEAKREQDLQTPEGQAWLKRHGAI